MKGNGFMARISRVPNNPLNFPSVSYFGLFCCDKTSAGSISFGNIVSLFTVNLPSNVDPVIGKLYLSCWTNLIWLHIKQMISVNGSLSSPSDVTLLDPSYNPCNCDLKIGFCDFNCCCDSMCYSSDIQLFDSGCPQTRGILIKDSDNLNCNDVYQMPRLAEEGWFPILCVQVKLKKISKIQLKNI